MNTEDVTFEKFWEAYPIKKDRKRAERAWNRLSKKDRQAAMAGVAVYKERCLRTGVFMTYGQGYLNRRRWEDKEDEITISATPNGNGNKHTANDTCQAPTDSTLEDIETW